MTPPSGHVSTGSGLSRVSGRFVFSLVVSSLLMCVPASGEQTVYRYRAFTGVNAPDTVSNYIVASSQLPPVFSVQRGDAGGPFHPFLYAQFAGDSHYLAQPFHQANSLSGDFTIAAHLMATHAGGGEQTIVSTVGGDGAPGISLKLIDGHLAASIWINVTAGDPIKRTLVSPEALAPDTWRRAVHRYRRGPEGSPHFHDLWIDEQRVAVETLPAPLTRTASELAPVFGAERIGSGFGDRLHAKLFAVQVDDYALSDFFLEAPLIRDGSDYFGMISHHDYLGLADQGGKLGGDPMEKRIVATYFNNSGVTRYPELDSRLQALWFLPFMNDDYVPQGFTTDPENKRVFLAYYHRTRENVQNTEPNMIAEVLLPEGRLANVFMLRDENNQPLKNSHMGGIAYWNGFLFAPDIGKGGGRPDMFAFDIGETEPWDFDPDTMEGFNPVQLRAVKRFVHPQGATEQQYWSNTLSFMGIHYGADHEPYLHFGHFSESEPRPTHIFKVGLAGDGTTREPVISNPVTLIQSHRRAQGMEYYFDVKIDGQRVRKAIQSNSWGNADSRLFTASYLEDSAPIGGAEFMRLPAGLEDIGRVGNTLMTWMESGATYFQKRTHSNPWTQLFPFMVSIDIADLLDTNGKGVPDEWYHRHGIALTIDPHTDLDGDGFTIYEEYLRDTDPNDPADYLWTTLSADPLTIALPTSFARYYTLLRSTDLKNWIPVPEVIHRRGRNSEWTIAIDESENNADAMFYRVLIETD